MIGPKAIIHLDRLVQNYKLVKQHVKNRNILAVVKTNAYGHGMVPVTKALESAGVSWFGVFNVEEAVELRSAGVAENIIVFCRLEPQSLGKTIDLNITLNLSCKDDLAILKEFHKTRGISPVVHLKVDTGMTRLGVPFENVASLLTELKDSPEIRCEGIYSHFATADEGNLSYAEFQLDRFRLIIDMAEKRGIKFKYIHLSNSGTVLNLPQAYFNMVRVGMLLYGAFPSDEVPMDLPIRPVMEFKGPIVNLRRVKAGTQVSYGGVWSASKDTTIGVVQTGFADGFPRPWYEKGTVGYKGKRYKIAGRVCMDQLTVDFGDAEVNEGDEVLFFGENEMNSIRVEEISGVIGFTPYVLLTAIGGRTERIPVGVNRMLDI